MKANCNWWQYARWVYLLGRSNKYRYFTETEKVALLDFIAKIAKTRPYIIDRLNLKKGNNGEWTVQNEYSIGRAIQLIGRQLKVQILTEEEKELCDVLFEKTDKRRFQAYNDYACDNIEEDASTSESTSTSTSESTSASTSNSESSNTTEDVSTSGSESGEVAE